MTTYKKNDPILNEIIDRLVSTLPVERIYLFGSRAYGNLHVDSDYDLLVVVEDNQNNIGALTDKGHRSLRGIEAFIDLVIMTKSSFLRDTDVVSTIPEIAIKDGIELYVI